MGVGGKDGGLEGPFVFDAAESLLPPSTNFVPFPLGNTRFPGRTSFRVTYKSRSARRFSCSSVFTFSSNSRTLAASVAAGGLPGALGESAATIAGHWPTDRAGRGLPSSPADGVHI